ncbi:hypothetical protein RIF29_11790 [Crotalaria pallida]|uniref:Uncharacterized protein n=1 Tax=Crotalaria pallida TaxID=3830 RepID=A0AAN9IMJ1_CROPI
MTLGSKEMADENKESDSVHDKNTNTNGVVITVYVESVKTRKTRPHPHFIRPRVSETEGYDRRAQLLAHSRQLRNQGSENVPLPSNQSQTIIKSKLRDGCMKPGDKEVGGSESWFIRGRVPVHVSVSDSSSIANWYSGIYPPICQGKREFSTYGHDVIKHTRPGFKKKHLSKGQITITSAQSLN